MIIYEDFLDPKTSKLSVIVKLDGKIVGTIHHTTTGWQYMPKGRCKLGGELFPTLHQCQQSLESA